MITVREIMADYQMSDADRDALEQALVAREDNIADTLRLAGAQFGLFPQIVAWVLSQTGLGSPVSDEERAMIVANYETLIEHLREEHGFPPEEQP